MKKGIAILGSTGSIGTQTLDVIRSHPDSFSVEVLTANSNAELLIQQAREFMPNAVVIVDEKKYSEVSDALSETDIKVFTGYDALVQVVTMEGIDLVVTALVGFAGLRPTTEAIRSGKQIGLANKETLVVAGDLITSLAKEHAVNIYPIDSEHSAIFQCMMGEWHNPIEKIYLTASGGPFRGMNRRQLSEVTRAQALDHPNWDMGAKITIDSASMMNKGLEMIEARWLFNLLPEQVDVIVHPQSIIHSIVQFQDGSMKAQMGLPDMKLPIQFAMGYPDRLPSDFPRFDFLRYPQLTFEPPDTDTFECLRLAADAMKKGGNVPCVLNAANEVAVQAFLDDSIAFTDIPGIISSTMAEIPFMEQPGLDEYIETDSDARQIAERFTGTVKS